MTRPIKPHAPLRPLTLTEWDDLIGRHLHMIEAGSEIVERHVEKLFGVPDWELRAFDRMEIVIRLLSDALLRLEKARQEIRGKPHVR